LGFTARQAIRTNPPTTKKRGGEDWRAGGGKQSRASVKRSTKLVGGKPEVWGGEGGAQSGGGQNPLSGRKSWSLYGEREIVRGAQTLTGVSPHIEK